MNGITKLFEEVDSIIRPLIDAVDVQDVSRFNRGYEEYSVDKFRCFINYEKARFAQALQIIAEDRTEGSIVDLGCFIPYLPVALSKLGYKTTIVDKYSLYSPRLKRCVDDLAEIANIRVCDLDLLEDDLAGLGGFDVVMLMSVIEHLNGSPRDLFNKIRGITNKNGILYLDVPNIAEFTKRIMLLIGRSPLPIYRTFYDSEYPFMGHNREMTASEVAYMLNRSGYAVEVIRCVDYFGENLNLKARMLRLLKKATPVANKGQLIIAKARVAQAGTARQD